MGAVLNIFAEEQRMILRMIAEAKPPSKDYPIASILKKAGPDQMYMWNRMIDRHGGKSSFNWGAATIIYKRSAKKHGVQWDGTTDKLGKPASATWGQGTKAYHGPGS